MEAEENIKAYLFARWLATCYGDDKLDEQGRYCDNPEYDESTAMALLNRVDGKWYFEQLQHFNTVVYPNYIKNGTVKSAEDFLKNWKCVKHNITHLLEDIAHKYGLATKDVFIKVQDNNMIFMRQEWEDMFVLETIPLNEI